MQSIETTATYDPATQEFVIDSPTRTSRKDYIGGAAETARVAAVFAQLITPDGLRGRVSAFQHMLQGGGPALGQSLMGAAAGAVGAPTALIGGAIGCLAICIALLLKRPDIRARDLGEGVDPNIAPPRARAEVG